LLFPVCYFDAEPGRIMLKVNAEQLMSFEKLQDNFIAAKLESFLVISLKTIQKAVRENDNMLYTNEVKRFDSQWKVLRMIG
jgi:hypothetical protein